MPNAPLSPCRAPGCGNLTNRRYCEVHAREYDSSLIRPGQDLYRSRIWKGLRRQVLKEQPFCAVPGCMNLSKDVDHIQAVRDGGDPIARANLQGLCHKHHSAKTASEVWHRT